MTVRSRSILAVFAVLACACGDPTPQPAPPPSRSGLPADAPPLAAAVSLGVTPLAITDRPGLSPVPSLLRAHESVALPAATATASARMHLARLAPAWGVRSSSALPSLDALGEIAVRGGTIVRFVQRLEGLPVRDGELRVMVRSDGGLVAIQGVLVGADAPRAPLAFAHDDAEAIAIAMRHAYHAPFDRAALAIADRRRDGRVLAGRSGAIDVQMAIARRMWHRVDGVLVPAYIVEAYAGPATSTEGDATRTIVRDGAVLAHESLVADAAFSYRVFAEPTGELHPFDGPIADVSPHPTGTPDGQYPPFVTPELITVDSLVSTNDPWLPAGRTETLGNNVEAYTDLNAPTGLTFGDFRATVTSPGAFDRAYDNAAEPLASQDQQMAAITSLFYVINWLHDFWYDAGFTEAAGNGQDNNFGRGGEDRDAILAEAQDNANGGSRNNANMSTPSDGLPPRMQVFLWSGKELVRTLAMQPSGRAPEVGTSAFSPANFDVTGELVLADDGTAPESDGCSPLINDVAGKIVVVDRGACSFKSKALQVQNAGGIGMVLANNNAAQTAPPTLGNDATIPTAITIAILSVTQPEGAAIKADLAGGPVTATLQRQVGPELDGGTDATLISHEFGHYVHHRLQQCGTAFCGAISEGWGDFLALMTMLRPGDNLDGAYPFGVYVTRGIVADPQYFGIRRAPYSVDQNINSLSFRHMADDAELPTTHPFTPFGNPAEVHNAGEVWASAMWEAYVALHEAAPAGTTFEDVRAKMAQYVVAGLLLAPTDGTPTETRDAILTAADAASHDDFLVLAAAFARRGLGSCAVSPDRQSTSFIGIVESGVTAAAPVLGATDVAETAPCDRDGIVDGTELGRITIPIANRGHLSLDNATATLTSTTTGVTITTLPIAIASLAPGATMDLAFDFALDDSPTTPLAGDFTLTIAAAGMCTAEVIQEVSIRLNVDDVPASSATDTFDTEASVWTPTFATVWEQQRESALDGIWHGNDLANVSDGALESPPLTASATEPVVVTFSHRFAFELANNVAFDGGVIELSTDAGATWRDVLELVPTVPYSPTAITTTSNNPLGGRPAFTGSNAAFPAADAVTLDFGMQLAGQTFQLRFRIGTDGGVGAPGWDLDDLAFTGLVGTPFPAQIADTGECAGPGPGDDGGVTPPDGGGMPPIENSGGCCDAGPARGPSLLLALGVLGGITRRRRRR